MATIVDQVKSLARALDAAARGTRRLVSVPLPGSTTVARPEIDPVEFRRREV